MNLLVHFVIYGRLWCFEGLKLHSPSARAILRTFKTSLAPINHEMHSRSYDFLYLILVAKILLNFPLKMPWGLGWDLGHDIKMFDLSIVCFSVFWQCLTCVFTTLIILCSCFTISFWRSRSFNSLSTIALFMKQNDITNVDHVVFLLHSLWDNSVAKILRAPEAINFNALFLII